MAKAVLTFTDESEEDVTVDVELDPPLGDRDIKELSQAQQSALALILYFFPEDGEDVVWKGKEGGEDDTPSSG